MLGTCLLIGTLIDGLRSLLFASSCSCAGRCGLLEFRAAMGDMGLRSLEVLALCLLFRFGGKLLRFLGDVGLN